MSRRIALRTSLLGVDASCHLIEIIIQMIYLIDELW